MYKKIAQPKVRSRLRLKCGTAYYRTKRYMKWMIGGTNFALRHPELVLSQIHTAHKTPLLRSLKDVDMYLQYNKIINLKIAAAKIDKMIIGPGETFSYWKSIGKPTKRKGYLPGMVLTGGTFQPGIGGGLCQMSNLLHWMALHTSLTVVERYRHGYDVFPDVDRTQPFGSGATCAYNYIDLMIRNDTNQRFQVNVWVSEDHLEGTITSDLPPVCRYEVYEARHWIDKEYWGGYTRHNVLCRKKYGLDGVVLDDEYLTENHALMMYNPFLEEGCL